MQNQIKLYMLIITSLLITISCGNSETTRTSSTTTASKSQGAVAFALKFADDTNNTVTAKSVTPMSTVNVCQVYGIDTITVKVFKDQAEIKSRSFPCESPDHSGTIDAIPADTGYRIVVQSLIAGNIQWRGEQDGVEVMAHQTTTVGPVVMDFIGGTEAPIAVTLCAEAIAATTATLLGLVNPRNDAATCRFEYGATTTYGSTTPDEDSADGVKSLAVTTTVSGLQANTVYHYRLVATNSYGTVYGDDLTFQTPNHSDTTPPHILPEGLAPADNAENVALEASITVQFDEAIQCDSSAVVLKDNDIEIPGRVTCSGGTLTFTPIWGLKYNKEGYSVTVNNTSVTDIAGTHLEAPVSWTFSTPRVCWIATDGALVKLDSLGNELVRIDPPFCQPLNDTQFALDPRDNALWISDYDGQLMKFSNEGLPLVYQEHFSGYGTAVDPRDGTVFVNGTIPNTDESCLWALSSLGLPLKHTLGVDVEAITWLNTDNTLWTINSYYVPGNVMIGRLSPDFPDNYKIDSYSSNDDDYSKYTGINFQYGKSELSAFGGNPNFELNPHIAVGGMSEVVVLEKDLSERWRVEPPGAIYINHITSDPHDGSIWAAGTGGLSDRVIRYSADGSQLLAPVAIPGVINTIEADPLDGGVWIGTRTDDGSQGALIRLSATGEELWRYTTQGGDLNSIIFPTYSSLNKTLFVAETGSDQEGVGTADQPLASIGEALNQAIDGDTIRVSAGTYQENITLKSGIRLIGEDAQATTIQGLGTTRVVGGVSIERVWIEGFTITGAGENTSGMNFEECRDIIIRGNIIRDNEKDGSDGISMTLSDGLISRNIITGNGDIGIIAGGYRGDYRYDKPDGRGVIIRNNIIAHNKAIGLSLSFGSTRNFVINNVIDSNGNAPLGGPGIMVNSNDYCVIKNNIISNNGGPNPDTVTPMGIWVSDAYSSGTELSYNNVYNNYAGGYTNITAGTGDISVDPLFEAQTYRLGEGSPSIDSGDPQLKDAGDCSRSDMGAYGGMFAMP